MTVLAADPVAPRPARMAELLSRDVVRLTIGTVLLLGCNAFEIIGAATGMPAVLDDLGGVAVYGAAVAAPLVGSVLAAPLGGRLADRWGTVKPLVLSLSLFAGGLIATALAPSMALVAAGRFLTGLGGGATLSLQLVIIARYVEVRLRALMLAVVGTVFVIPGLIGPSVSATLSATVGWRWIFGGVVPIVVLCAALLVPDITRRQRVDGDSGDGEVEDRPWWGPLLLASGLAVTVLAGAADLRWVPLAVLGIALAAFGARATMPRGTWTARRGFPAAVTCTIGICAAYLTSEAFLPLLLRELRGKSLLEAGLPLTVAAVFWCCAGWYQARLRPAQRPGWARVAALLAASGLFLAALLVFDQVPFWLAYPATALGSYGCGMVFTIAQTVAVESAPAGQEGAYTSSIQLANLLGTAIGTSATAIVIARLHGRLSLAIGITMFATVGAALLVAVIAPRFAPATRRDAVT